MPARWAPDSAPARADNCYDFWCGVDGQGLGLAELGLPAAECARAAPDMLRRAAALAPERRAEPAAAAALLALATEAVCSG